MFYPSPQIWDLSAGKIIADFKNHTGAVNTIQFHPKEYLMSSGSSDKTVKFYDLERFEVVSEIPPSANVIRKILFHPDGSGLFTGTQEALKASIISTAFQDIQLQSLGCVFLSLAHSPCVACLPIQVGNHTKASTSLIAIMFTYTFFFHAYFLKIASKLINQVCRERIWQL